MKEYFYDSLPFFLSKRFIVSDTATDVLSSDSIITVQRVLMGKIKERVVQGTNGRFAVLGNFNSGFPSYPVLVHILDFEDDRATRIKDLTTHDVIQNYFRAYHERKIKHSNLFRDIDCHLFVEDFFYIINQQGDLSLFERINTDMWSQINSCQAKCPVIRYEDQNHNLGTLLRGAYEAIVKVPNETATRNFFCSSK